MIPDALWLRTRAVWPFVEAIGLSAAAETRFEEAAVLLQLGYPALPIQEGFNARHGADYEEKSEQSLPYHPEVLRQELQRIDLDSLHEFRRTCIRTLDERGLIKGQTDAIDGRGIGEKIRVVGMLNSMVSVLGG